MSTANPTPLPRDLSPTVLDRLHDAGVEPCEDWVALKERRRQIFGIPPRAIQEIDNAVRDALRGAP